MAGNKSKFGKDSELATMLVQGKPVIVYVPEGNQFEQRAKEFKELHPLSMQVDLTTGVAHGVIVVRNASQCRNVLCNIFTDQLETKIDDDHYNYYLREVITNSRIRVKTKDHYLFNAFWNYYLRAEIG